MSENIFLSVVIPAYNEEANLQTTLQQVSEYLQSKDFSHELILVDDGSTDRTYNIAQRMGQLFSHFILLKNVTNKGKGFTVKYGVLTAKGKYTLFMDADNSTSIYEFDKFLPYLEEGYDAVIASRRIQGANVEKSQTVLRRILGNVYIILSKILLNHSIHDFNCGFKAFLSKSANPVFQKLKMNDWSFDSELLLILKKHMLKIKEVPVTWISKETSKVKPFKDGINSFLSLIKIKMNDIKGLYK